MVYEWKTPLYKVNPQEAGEYLDRLAKKAGGLVPKTIVEEAEDPQAVLHPCFEWDDTFAAQKYREDQARSVIRNLVVIHETGENVEPLKTRAFVRVAAEQSTHSRYVDIASALADSKMRGGLLETAKNELRSFQIKYHNLNELVELFEAMNQFLEF